MNFSGWRGKERQKTIGIGCIKGWESISKDESKSLVMSTGHRLIAVIVQLNNSF